jgi:hypothetical protein
LSLPLDPSRKTGYKLCFSKFSLHRYAAAPPPQQAVAAATLQARALAAEARRLEARVVPRPKPPLWWGCVQVESSG